MVSVFLGVYILCKFFKIVFFLCVDWSELNGELVYVIFGSVISVVISRSVFCFINGIFIGLYFFKSKCRLCDVYLLGCVICWC